MLTATVTVESPGGAVAVGEAAMPQGNVWAFPSRLPYARTLEALSRVADRIAGLYEESRLTGHPVEITHELEAQFWPAAHGVASELALGEPIPRLATLVAASPIDAALHDAYGKLHGASVYQLYGPDALPGELSRFLGESFRKPHARRVCFVEAARVDAALPPRRRRSTRSRLAKSRTPPATASPTH